MKIAYLILAHKNPGQLARLIAALSRPESVFYVHIDRKVKEEPFRRALQTFGADTIFVRERHTVSWGGFSIVEATLSLIRDCLAGADKVDRAVLLSGQDYPIKSCNQILQFFEESREQEFIEHFELPSTVWSDDDGGMDRIRYYWFIDRLCLRYSRWLIRLQKALGITRRLPRGVRFFGGSQWFMLSANCLRFVNEYCGTHPEFVRFWRSTKISDEMFFNTIVMNSTMVPRVRNNNALYTDWLKGPEKPRILRLDDFPALTRSNCLFARKFDTGIEDSSMLLDKIDQEILLQT